jgi:[ribosomal protein S18]-alanine N-acetyltransferase
MLVVEPARGSDMEPVARLAAHALAESYDPAWLARHAWGRGTFLVARDVPTNQVVGFAVAERESCEAHLLAIAVETGRRGEGIGSHLLRTVRQELARAGAYRLELEVRADDARAQAFYVRHGFMPRGLESGVYRDGGDAVRMERPL